MHSLQRRACVEQSKGRCEPLRGFKANRRACTSAVAIPAKDGEHAGRRRAGVFSAPSLEAQLRSDGAARRLRRGRAQTTSPGRSSPRGASPRTPRPSDVRSLPGHERLSAQRPRAGRSLSRPPPIVHRGRGSCLLARSTPGRVPRSRPPPEMIPLRSITVNPGALERLHRAGATRGTVVMAL